MKKVSLLCGVALAAATLAVPAYSQDAAPATAESQATPAATEAATVTVPPPPVVQIVAPAPVPAGPPPCELHVWPAERMNSMTTGLLGGGLLDAAIHANKDASNRASLASALDSPTQLDALQSLDERSS